VTHALTVLNKEAVPRRVRFVLQFVFQLCSL